MQKRGQVTLFVIIGLVILLVVGAWIFFRSDYQAQELETQEGIPLQTGPVSMLVTSCLTKTAEDGVLHIGKQGGFYNVEQPAETFTYFTVPHYFDQGPQRLTDKSMVEDEHANYIQQKIGSCLNYSSLEEQGYQITSDAYTIESTIGEKGLIVNMEYPITVVIGSQQKDLKLFRSRLDVNLLKVLGIVQKVYDEQKEDQSSIPIGYLSELAEEENFEFVTTHIENDIVLFNLFFEMKVGDEELYNFAYSVQYNWTNLNYSIEEEVELSEHPDYVLNRHSETLATFTNHDISSDTTVDPVQEFWNNPEQVSGMSNYNLIWEVGNDASLLSNPNVQQQFESRLNNPEFLNLLNNKRNTLNAWATSQGISFGENGQLAEFRNGLITTKGSDGMTFDPKHVPGATVLESGKLELADGATVAGAEISRSGDTLQIDGGIVDLSNSKDLSDLKVTQTVVFMDDFEIIPEADNPLSIRVDASGRPHISGSKVLVVKDGQDLVEFTGRMSIDPHKLIAQRGSVFTDYNSGEKSTWYHVTRRTDYFWKQGECGKIKTCIEKDLDTGRLYVSTHDTDIRIKALDHSIRSVKVPVISKGSVEFNDIGNVRLIFSNQRLKVKGDPAKLTVAVEDEYISRGDRRTLKLTPSDEGVTVHDCTHRGCRRRGTLTKEALLAQEGFKRNKANQATWASELGTRYGGRDAKKYMGFLDDPHELHILNGIQDAAQRSGLDSNFLTSAGFIEGMVLWMQKDFRRNPNAEVSAYLHIGADRFGKEVRALKAEGYLPEDYNRKNYRIDGTHTNEAGEVVPAVYFKNPASAFQGMAAMLKRRQDLLVKDLSDNGIDPKHLSKKEINYWTYVYYNAGSGCPEDCKGKGRSIIRIRAKRGAGAFRIPTAPRSPGNPLGNAQRVISTHDLLARGNPLLPESPKMAVGGRIAGIQPESEPQQAATSPGFSSAGTEIES